MKKIALILICLLFSFSLFSNELGDITITGKVINKQTKLPLPYVTIALKGNIATYTDLDGNFKLTFDDKYINDTVKITYMGFEKQAVPVQKFKNFTVVVIELKPIDYKIDDVVVTAKSQSPQTIIKNVNENIFNNYIHQSFNYILKFQNERFTNNADKKSVEASVILYDKSGYSKSDNISNFQNISYSYEKINRNYKVNRLYDGYFNIDNILKADIVRNNHNVLNLMNVNDFDFIVEHSILGNDSIWVLKYNCKTPKFENSGSNYCTKQFGEIIVNKKDFAILKHTCEMNFSNISQLGFSFFTNELQVSEVKLKYSTIYQKNENLYNLKSIEYELSYKENNNIIIEKTSLSVEKTNSQVPKEIVGRQYFAE